RRLARAEGLEARGFEIVHNSGNQRRLGSHYDEIDLARLAKRHHCGVVGNVDRHALGLARDAGVARRAPQLRGERGAGNFPGERMLASARAEQEDVHGAAVAGFVHHFRVTKALVWIAAFVPGGSAFGSTSMTPSRSRTR